MKILLRKLKLQFDGPVQVSHIIDNFNGDNTPIREKFNAYVEKYEPFINNGKPSHFLERDNLQALKSDTKEQIANWCRKQAEEAEIPDVDFEEPNSDFK